MRLWAQHKFHISMQSPPVGELRGMGSIRSMELVRFSLRKKLWFFFAAMLVPTVLVALVGLILS